jgi:D-glycero-D-manno-heptose 1,7-bisphosphate phosphatase
VKNLYIFDKDKTLVGPLEGPPANSIEEQNLLPSVAEKCAALRAQGHTLAVASNQGGVAWGFLTEDEAYALVEHAAGLIGAEAIAMCPHHPKGRIEQYAIKCPRRKPESGMLLDLMRRLGFHASRTVYVGDMDTDRQAAEAAGIQFIWAKDFFK